MRVTRARVPASPKYSVMSPAGVGIEIHRGDWQSERPSSGLVIDLAVAVAQVNTGRCMVSRVLLADPSR
jgi:hypothetical protein